MSTAHRVFWKITANISDHKKTSFDGVTQEAESVQNCRSHKMLNRMELSQDETFENYLQDLHKSMATRVWQVKPGSYYEASISK